METECVNRPPPSHPQTNRRNPAGTSAVNSGQQGPGLSAHPQPFIPLQPQPVYYVPPAPPPSLLHYQWPGPFQYNPFTGFPGMGYGMVISPFPPAPYMEAPGYVLPHPHVQPVNYRRFPHPQVPAARAPCQSQNQNHRFRTQYVSGIRQTVNAEVQTEPALTRNIGSSGQRSPLAGSESGHGTTSPSSSSSSTEAIQRGHTEVENHTVPCRNARHDCLVNTKSPGRGTAKDGFKTSSPALVTKERRVSFPDILMSWEGSTPPVTMPKTADKALDLPAAPEETEAEHEKTVNLNPAEQQSSQAAVDGKDTKDCDTENVLISKERQALHQILKLPFPLQELLSETRRENESAGLVGSVRTSIPSRERAVRHELLNSLNESQRVPDADQENSESLLLEKTTESLPDQVSFRYVQIKRKLNESVWSVDSLAPYIPSLDWLIQNGVIEPDVIIEEIAANDENGALSSQNDSATEKVMKEKSSSDREDDDVRTERQVSCPDIVMSREGSTPPVIMPKMADKVLDQPAFSEEAEAEHERTVNLSLTEQQSSQVVVDGKDTQDMDTEHFFLSKEREALHHILKLSFPIKELNESQRVPDADQENSESLLLEKTTESLPDQVSSRYIQIKRKLNESVWSVESLAPYIPSQDWLIQNGVIEPDVIIEEIAANDENGALSMQNDSAIDKMKNERKGHTQVFHRLSSDSLPVIVSPSRWLGDRCKVNCHNRFPLASQQNIDAVFSTPAETLNAEKRPEMQCKGHPSKLEGQLKQSLSLEPPVKDHLASPPPLQSEKGSSTESDAEKSGSSEPGANQSLNQKCVTVIEQREPNPCSPELEELPASSPLSHHIKEVKMEQKTAVRGHEETSQLRPELLGVKLVEHKLSPSKGDFVDCGVQCSEFQEEICSCENGKNKTGVKRKSPFKHSADSRKANKAKAVEEASENGHLRRGQWKSKQQGGNKRTQRY
ncbi:uncharacterized protein LOC115364431 [Myripristis murdjan]|uniref:uncharacterized protein LOC115364431 n=1 Tax=Myripristis murdjan TaxID=586833 RepID=UPI00117606D7|nr:uncharacterized protein LOC115364431 [Myripristis murdjan]